MSANPLPDGWRGYTYPRLKQDDPWYAWLERNRQKSAC